MALELPADVAFLPDSEQPYVESDYFGVAEQPREAGFAGREFTAYYRLATGEECELGSKPLVLPPTFDRAAWIDLHEALALIDPQAHVYGAVQHLHLGVPVVTVAVAIGQGGRGEVLYEVREPATGFVSLRIESNAGAFRLLQQTAPLLARWLAATTLRQVIKKLGGTDASV